MAGGGGGSGRCSSGGGSAAGYSAGFVAHAGTVLVPVANRDPGEAREAFSGGGAEVRAALIQALHAEREVLEATEAGRESARLATDQRQGQ